MTVLHTCPAAQSGREDVTHADEAHIMRGGSKMTPACMW